MYPGVVLIQRYLNSKKEAKFSVPTCSVPRYRS